VDLWKVGAERSPAEDERSTPAANGGKLLNPTPSGGEVSRMPPRFLTLADVAETLNTSGAQVYALVRSGELRAIKIGGRGQWRIETTELEAFIQRMYAETDAYIAAHPPGRGESPELD
jgi:excisionase family DNA binding protein